MSVKFQDDFFKKLEKIDKPAFLKKMTNEAGIIAVNFSKERFRAKNWIDRSRESWQGRKRKGRGSLLSQSGRLKRSIRKLAEGNYYVFIGTDVPYAQIHNEGGTINKTVSVRSHTRRISSRKRKTTRGNGKPVKATARVRSHTRRMNLRIVKRQFMGESAVLTRRVERHMHKRVINELKKN